MFLIRAAGRSGEEMVRECERRLGNTKDEEFVEIARQLREIAMLRLRESLAGAAAS